MIESSWVPLNAQVRPVGRKLVRFSLADVASWVQHLETCGGGRSRTGDTLAERVQAAAPEIATALEEAWDRLGLSGAVLVYSGDTTGPLRTSPVGDPLVVVNVLARARNNLLLPQMPLALDPQHLDRILVTDDPRLVVLSEATTPAPSGGPR